MPGEQIRTRCWITALPVMVGPTIVAILFHGMFTPWALHSDWIDNSNFLSISSDESSVKRIVTKSCVKLTSPANKGFLLTASEIIVCGELSLVGGYFLGAGLPMTRLHRCGICTRSE